VAAVVVAATAALTGRRTAAGGAAGVAVAAWGANAAALLWGRRLPRRDAIPVALVSLGVPWVYVLYYYRGVLRFRHLPRL
jgi:hypothetical protein